MHDPQEELFQENEEKAHGIDLHAAYKVLVRAFYRLECSENGSKEEDHA